MELDQRGGLVVNGVPLPHQLYYAVDAHDEGEAQLGYALHEISALSAGRDPGDPPMEVTVQDQRAGGLGVHRFSLPPRTALTLADLRVPASPVPPASDARRLPSVQEQVRAAGPPPPVAMLDPSPAPVDEPAASVATPAASVATPAQIEPEPAAPAGPATARTSGPGGRAGRHRAGSRAGGAPPRLRDRVAITPPSQPEPEWEPAVESATQAAPGPDPGPVLERAIAPDLEHDPLVAFVRSLAAPPVEAPPVEAPPVVDPPVEASPVEASAVTASPVVDPPVVGLPVPASPAVPMQLAPVPMRRPGGPVPPMRPQLIEFVPNPSSAETAPESEPPSEAVPLPEEKTPEPAGRRRPRRRRLLLVVVVALLVGFGVGRAVVAARATHPYTAVCVDLRTQQRVQIDRCALADQGVYRRWYIKAGSGVPAVGEAPRTGGTSTPTGRKVRINEAFRPGAVNDWK
ncbi:hypothetical protein AB0H83_36195 [Dactylosporangium sp. NPDC050688]|uniref:hypothetical protein n=1 Tax=Dactylosporangium sp. NPDC050688 TaxID=3157217 RepID=UPI0033D1716D